MGIGHFEASVNFVAQWRFWAWQNRVEFVQLLGNGYLGIFYECRLEARIQYVSHKDVQTVVVPVFK